MSPTGKKAKAVKKTSSPKTRGVEVKGPVVAKETMDGAQAIVRELERQGVEYIFGLSGGAAIPIFDALITTRTKIKLVLVRHEQGATHIADGYARVKKRPGVVLVTSGPGATNTVTGIMTAAMDSVPLVVLTGQTISPMLGKDAFQEADVFGITMPVVKHSYLVKKTNDLARVVKEAFYISSTGRPGPVLIDIPKDISAGPFTDEMDPPMDLPGYDPEISLDMSKVELVAEALSKARRPVILAGQGALISGAEDAVRRLAEKMRAPVTTTLLGKGVISETHPLSLGMMGMHGTAYSNKAVTEADVLISIGSRFDDRIIGQAPKFAKNAIRIHIDIDAAEINKMIHVHHYCVGDAKKVVEELIKRVHPMDTSDWLNHLDEYKKKYPLKYKKYGGLKMQHIIDELWKLTDGKAIISPDVGQHQMWAAQFYKTERPDGWLSSGGAGTMGYGFPAAIGAQFAAPNDQVWAIVGDGGFQMTMCELATACVNKLPVKVLVLNNNYLGMVRQWQELFFESRESGVDLEGNPDFAKLAEAYPGAKGFTLRRGADIRKILKRAMEYNDGPSVINAIVEKTDNVYPMVPAGRPIDEMLLEAPKHKMEKPTGST